MEGTCRKYRTKGFIFYFNCEHFLFVCIVKHIKIEICWRLIFEILIIHNLSGDQVRSHTKFGPNRFSCFDVYCVFCIILAYYCLILANLTNRKISLQKRIQMVLIRNYLKQTTYMKFIEISFLAIHFKQGSIKLGGPTDEN